MIAEDYTSVEIAAALVKMAMNRENYNENVTVHPKNWRYWGTSKYGKIFHERWT